MSEIVERVIVNKEDLEELADSVRAAKNETGAYQWDALKTSAIEIIGSGGLDTSDATAKAKDILSGKTAYINSEKVTGTMINNGAISQTIDGLDTKTATIPAGYTSGGTVSVDDTVDNIADEQADLIGQIEAALANKTAVSPTLQEKTVSPSISSQSVTPDSGYDGLSKVTVNAMPTATQATPSITVSSAGLITASSTQTAGYVSAGTKTATKQLTTQAAQTITPGTSNKTIASGRYLTGTQTIKGDANLVAANIANGISIFGVTGTHSGGEDVSAETATYTGLLDDLESAIDALPDAGSSGGSSGGSIETCTVTVQEEIPGLSTYAPSGDYYYTGADMVLATGQWTAGTAFTATIAKGTAFIIEGFGTSMYSISGSASLLLGGVLGSTTTVSIFSVNSDSTITLAS